MKVSSTTWSLFILWMETKGNKFQSSTCKTNNVWFDFSPFMRRWNRNCSFPTLHLRRDSSTLCISAHRHQLSSAYRWRHTAQLSQLLLIWGKLCVLVSATFTLIRGHKRHEVSNQLKPNQPHSFIQHISLLTPPLPLISCDLWVNKVDPVKSEKRTYKHPPPSQ